LFTPSAVSYPILEKNVLILDGDEAMQDLRAGVMRKGGVHVYMAKNVAQAELAWVPNFFHLVLLDARHRSKEVVAFWRMIKRQHPEQEVRFLVGPPTYISTTCADTVISKDADTVISEHKIPSDWVQRLRLLASA
jgi:hypothetical protein